MCEREKTTVLSGRIEADDAYLGGENPDGKAGRGSENKVPFVAAVQTIKEEHPVYAVLSPMITSCVIATLPHFMASTLFMPTSVIHRNVFMKYLLYLPIAILLFLQTNGAWASPNSTPLIFSGFAFSGDFNNREQLYPYSAEISKEDDGRFLDNILTKKLKDRPELMKRVSLELSDGKRDLSSLAFTLVQENVETQQIDGKYWVIVTLQANVLAFNRASSSIVASYPLRMRFTSVRESVPTDLEKRALIREAYTSNVKAENIFDQWLNRLELVNMREGARKYLRVTGVEVTPEAERVILDSGKNVQSVKNQVANFLEAAISDKSGVPVVPNSVGEAIGNKMACRFSNGSELQFTLPDPDFSLSFVIRGFVSKRIEEPEYYQDIFRVKGKITLKQPDLEKTILDEDVYNTVVVTCPKQSKIQLSSWDQYFKTLESLVFMIGKQISNVEDSWLKENASRAANAKPGFLSAKQLLKELI